MVSEFGTKGSSGGTPHRDLGALTAHGPGRDAERQQPGRSGLTGVRCDEPACMRRKRKPKADEVAATTCSVKKLSPDELCELAALGIFQRRSFDEVGDDARILRRMICA